MIPQKIFTNIRTLQRSVKGLNMITTCCFSSIQNDFNAAVNNVTKLNKEPDNQQKLKLYALFKQSTVGKCNAKKPGALDFVAKYKWDAWNKLGEMSTDDAKLKYIETVQELINEIGMEGGSSSSSSIETSSSGEEIVLSIRDGVLTLRLNRPKKYNAITLSMYQNIAKAFNDAAKDDSVKLGVLTGTGDYYSSGNDLTTMTKIDPNSESEMKKMAEDGKNILIDFVDSFINFPKPLIAAINGPCLGISCTTSALCDIIVASDTAYFTTPFSGTAQTPEGCSSAIFPTILGYSKASQMLMFNHKMNAEEALSSGFISKVIPKSNWDQELEEMIYGAKGIVKTCSASSMIATKGLIRNNKTKDELRKINRMECDTLVKAWLSPEFPQFIAKFMTRKQ